MTDTERSPDLRKRVADLTRDFPQRLKQAIGDRSVLSFARACGMSDSLVRKYLAGSLPGLDKAVLMAREAGVSLEWLGTGEEAPSRGPRVGHDGPLDLERMEEVIASTRRHFRERGIELSAESEAKIIRMIYEFDARGGVSLSDAELERLETSGALPERSLE